MADYLSKEEILQAFGCLTVKNPDDKYQHGMQDAIDCLIPEVINEMGAADVQPIKHGRWELTNNPSFRKCSECGAWCSSDITDNCFTNYCPKCGARMDGEQNEDN